MSFECASGVSDDCVGSDLFDPPYRDEDGAAICTYCARELEISFPKAHDRASDSE